MPRVKPEIIKWARENFKLTIEEAVKNLQEATQLYLEEFPLQHTYRSILTTFEVAANA